MPNKFNLSHIKALVIDMDGVLWRGDTPLPGLPEFFDFLHRQSIPYMLATNNAGKTPAQYQQKFARFGVTINPEYVMTSALATAIYLKREFNEAEKVYVIGGTGIREAVHQAGFTVVDNADQSVKAVVTSIDFELTYNKLKYAVLLIQRGAHFVATNGDVTFPAEEGYYPGGGAILAAIQAATKVEPSIIGKPESLMFELALQKIGGLPEHTAMLGDRLGTDILGGQRAGLKTILVTTGVDNANSIAQQGIQPDVIFSGIDALVEEWQKENG